jgi:hypothetical protein
MRKLLIGAVVFAGLAIGSTANAAISIGSITPGTNPYNSYAPTYNFDVGSRPAAVGGAFVSGTLGIQHAQPYGTAAGTGAYGLNGGYYAVGPSDGSPGTLNLTGIGDITSLSLVWGSVDAYNTLDFCADAACTSILQSFTGNQIFNPANGNRTDPNTNPVVLFLLTGSDVTNFNYLRLNSSQNAFEIDNLAINPVPEPGTWALMLVGFAGIGMSLRRRRRTVLAQVA